MKRHIDRGREPDTVQVNICYCLKIIRLVYSVTVPEYFDTSQLWTTRCILETIQMFSLLYYSLLYKGHGSVKC